MLTGNPSYSRTEQESLRRTFGPLRTTWGCPRRAARAAQRGPATAPAAGATPPRKCPRTSWRHSGRSARGGGPTGQSRRSSQRRWWRSRSRRLGRRTRCTGTHRPQAQPALTTWPGTGLRTSCVSVTVTVETTAVYRFNRVSSRRQGCRPSRRARPTLPLCVEQVAGECVPSAGQISPCLLGAGQPRIRRLDLEPLGSAGILHLSPPHLTLSRVSVRDAGVPRSLTGDSAALSGGRRVRWWW